MSETGNGRHQFLLLNKDRESLAGRCAIFELYPLTIPELMTEKWDEDIHLSFFQEFLQKGSLLSVLPSFMLDPDYVVRE
jgi:predicted AAA+ superfamily ATPase